MLSGMDFFFSLIFFFFFFFFFCKFVWRRIGSDIVSRILALEQCQSSQQENVGPASVGCRASCKKRT